jgi:hypothetical protein
VVANTLNKIPPTGQVQIGLLTDRNPIELEETKPMNSQPSHLSAIGRWNSGQVRTYRVSHTPAHNAAYRRLAAAILGLDVAFLANDLKGSRAELAALTIDAA